MIYTVQIGVDEDIISNPEELEKEIYKIFGVYDCYVIASNRMDYGDK